ncbi:hypothetical protein CcaverHIS002_0212890 [Cutaneotrichosporon cavernicola]|uniref:Uncharacterized protein n=1 Tax=Cutaneotrichosporon cavernicola TaxID=279322 RepID=A0AA48IBT8_9TREE|nr:uncharacterized protein CcaverHIS019_0212890 [Cutaneotrichosporon cavernicola]BEI82129.1 hypothetical protein CcaverHIS002_0212890 [Cutaneotrichosporon cavernicola]BEI89927.1 hypothetical protein CcaverHIS019_0212890 [Cutaneotrichosporon cavernicola]BEI97698.1 hypothetical protein CcaverHIS631_0212870 [Cutaneotrichosporon cavernicola]
MAYSPARASSPAASQRGSDSDASYCSSDGSDLVDYVADLSLAHTFPRTQYLRQHYYAAPDRHPSARMLWVARDASAAWARAVATRDWGALDKHAIELAVFDKAYELNQAQWPRRKNPSQLGWEAHTDGLAMEAYNAAARSLHPLRARMPPPEPILRFCRLALDLCAAPLIDAGPVRPRLALLPDADLGRLLGAYDPLVRHAAGLAQDLKGAGPGVPFVFNEAHLVWMCDGDSAHTAGASQHVDKGHWAHVLTGDEEDVPGLTSGSSVINDSPRRPSDRARDAFPPSGDVGEHVHVHDHPPADAAFYPGDADDADLSNDCRSQAEHHTAPAT